VSSSQSPLNRCLNLSISSKSRNVPLRLGVEDTAITPALQVFIMGFVVDLSKLNSVEISDDESTAFIGTGNRWRDVYPVLEKRGLLTIGGRAGAVGVGVYFRR
jgi:hypothetical protein